MTRRFNIQEQTFEVKDEIYDKLIVDPRYDPIEYNKYLNNFRFIKFDVKYTKELIKKDCEICITLSGTEYCVDKNILALLYSKKIKEVEERDHIRNFQPPVSGEDIMAHFGLNPCREIGIIKEAIKEAILEGEVENNYADAYAFMLKKAAQITACLGLKTRVETTVATELAAS